MSSCTAHTWLRSRHHPTLLILDWSRDIRMDEISVTFSLHKARCRR